MYLCGLFVTGQSLSVFQIYVLVVYLYAYLLCCYRTKVVSVSSQLVGWSVCTHVSSVETRANGCSVWGVPLHGHFFHRRYPIL